MASPTSPSFQFLAGHDPLLVALGAQAERFFAEGPVSYLTDMKRLFHDLREVGNRAIHERATGDRT